MGLLHIILVRIGLGRPAYFRVLLYFRICGFFVLLLSWVVMKKCVLIDGNALVHRCYHAVPSSLTLPSGQPINAVYGFTSILLGILEVEKPDYLATAWDMKGPTFRHEVFTEYKATRAKTDDTLISQFPLLRELLNALGVAIFEKEGLEADDYLGILTSEIRKEHSDVDVVIVTADQDALQLVEEGVTVVAPISGYTKVRRYNSDAVKEKLGVWPWQVPDYKGLAGDSSDNLPGVKGIGEKTAAKLLEDFKTVEGIYEHLEEVKPERVRERLREHEAMARMCKEVATILREDGVAIDLKLCSVQRLDVRQARAIFDRFGFKTSLGRIEKLRATWEKERESAMQGSLF